VASVARASIGDEPLLSRESRGKIGLRRLQRSIIALKLVVSRDFVTLREREAPAIDLRSVPIASVVCASVTSGRTARPATSQETIATR